MTDGAFPRDKHLTAIAVAYKNPDAALIADAVLPRVTVGKTNFEWYEYPLAEGFTVPDTRVGEKSQVPRLELSGTRKSATTEDFGLEIPLTKTDIDDAPPGVDPRERATEQATNLTLLDREIRVSNLLFDASKYAAANKSNLATLGGNANNQWSDYTNSDPLKLIIESLDACPLRPNVIAFGQQVWNKLSMHPKVVKAANGNDGGEGRATRQRIAELLELSEVLVGSAFVNSVKPGKAPVLVRTWGKHALAFFRDRTVGTSGGITFGITAQYGTRVAGSKEIDIGLRGGVAVRSGESVKELIIAPDAAFFFQNAIA